jgi:bacterioferritin-associated ferredoxin
MIVCLCRGVSDGKVRLAVLEGASNLKEVSARCAAGRGCGACHEQIRDLIEAHSPLAAQEQNIDDLLCPLPDQRRDDTVG